MITAIVLLCRRSRGQECGLEQEVAPRSYVDRHMAFNATSVNFHHRHHMIVQFRLNIGHE